jgi:phage shock protein PspC (stress-responsive transcriptional regulator)
MVGASGLDDASTMTTQATQPPPESPAPASRRLVRTSGDRVIAGVAGGLGRYFSIDPVIFRIAFVVGAFFGGAGIVAYGIAWLLVPSEDGTGAAGGSAGVARRLGIAVGMLVLTGVALVGGFWGAGSGGATATAIIVIALGGVLVIGAFSHGMRWLIVPALALALAAATAAAANLDLRGGIGERVYTPQTGSALQSNYKLGVGHLRVDLRNAKLGTGDYRVHLKLGMGQAEVLVPSNVCVSSTAHIAGGATTVFDNETGGSYHDWQDLRTPAKGNAHLSVDADIGFGQLRIERDVTGMQTQDGACTNG